MSVTLRGLTWDHPRAYQGLLLETERFNASQSTIHLVWERHSLRAFEAPPIAELAAGYDLITFDHPFGGATVWNSRRWLCGRAMRPDARLLDRGQPRDEDTEGGNQPANESLINRPLKLNLRPSCEIPAHCFA